MKKHQTRNPLKRAKPEPLAGFEQDGAFYQDSISVQLKQRASKKRSEECEEINNHEVGKVVIMIDD